MRGQKPAALNYQTNEEEEEGSVEVLKSTLCFDKGSLLIVDVKLFVVGVCIKPFLPPHCWDAAVGPHPVPPQAEAAAGFQRGQLDVSAWAQLQQEEDASEGGDDGHAAQHSDGDGQTGVEFQLRFCGHLFPDGDAGGLPHVLTVVQAPAHVQGAVRRAGQAGVRAEAAAGQTGQRAGQAGRDGGWEDGVSHRVVERLRAHCEARRTFFHTALLEGVVARVALCDRIRNWN